jgi:DNA mismatch endonuclease, patch repair protein
MSQIKSGNTKPEMIVRRYLFYEGFRYRLHKKDLPGKPDIVLKKYNTVVFIHGCFWHGHAGCKYFKIPKTRTEWWKEKINSNIDRDQKNEKELEKSGWKVVTVFECDLKGKKLSQTLTALKKEILRG